jgi:hypothetical protein
MKKEDLLNLISDDDLGLLVLKAKNASVLTEEERLVASFFEISNFFEVNNREPRLGGEMMEHQLASRLAAIRKDNEKQKVLLDFDEFHLLDVESKEIKSMNDVFEDDEVGILDNAEEGIFQMKSISAHNERNAAEYIARRKPCQDFQKYEPLFIQCQAELAAGKRKLIKFTSEKQVTKNSFFVLNGVLLFIEEIGKTYIDKFGKINGRQKCIFENGTESNMLFRSLVQRLYEDGHAVTENSDDAQSHLLRSFNVITEEDSQTGYIYIAKSLSNNPKISALDNLYKIGFSTTPAEERVKNAAIDPTYLMAPVKIITTFECYNFNPQKLEQLLHNFFGTACLNVDIFDANNRRFTPREWFIAPLEVIEKAIELIINGGIVNFRYDPDSQKIVLR